MKLSVVPAALTVMAITAGVPGTASAADYGGGALPASMRQLDRGGFSAIALRTSGASVLVNARIHGRCGAATVTRRAPLAADGSFTLRATVRERLREDRQVRRTARIVVFGRIVGTTGTGNTRARVTYRGPRGTDRCTLRPRAFQVRAASAEGAPGAARAGTTYHGLTSQRARRPRPFVLRVDSRARRIVSAVFQYRLSCGTGPISYNNITPGTRIAPDGTFGRTERFSLRFSNAVERFRVRLQGRFTPNGVSGTMSVSSVARAFSGRVIDRCRTGRFGFAATP